MGSAASDDSRSIGVRTALLRIGTTETGFEARLVEDWDGRSEPPSTAPSVRFDALPAPPSGFKSIPDFLLNPQGASNELIKLGEDLQALVLTGEIGTKLEELKAEHRLLLLDLPEPLREL